MSLADIFDLPPEEQEAILNGPSIPPPDGVIPNLTDPPNGNTLAFAVMGTCLTVATFLVLMRAYSRFILLKLYRLEDALPFITLGCLGGYVYGMVRHAQVIGFFVHQWDVPVKNETELLYLVFVGSNLYSVMVICLKSAILLEWLRLFVPWPVRTAFFWSCSIILGVNLLFYISGLIALNLQCVPYRSIWDLSIEGKCVNTTALNNASAIINLISDIVLLALVQQIIWGMRLTIKKRIGVSLIFAAGIFGCVASAFQLAVTLKYESENDISYAVSSVILWGLGEITAGFVVLCVPAAPKVFRDAGMPTKIMNALRSLTHRSIDGTHRSTDEKGSNKSAGSSREEIKVSQELSLNKMPSQEGSSSLDTATLTHSLVLESV